MTRAEREREIQSFAESQGWTAAIVEGGFGMRAIFQMPDQALPVQNLGKISLSVETTLSAFC